MGIAEENAKYFNEHASQYDDIKWAKDLQAQIMRSIRENIAWISADVASKHDSKEIRLLDYASGTGHITKSLAPYITTATGIDVSSSMVDIYNKVFQDSPFSASAIVGNLLGDSITPPLEEPQYFGYDIAVVGLGFHHFEDPVLAAKRLAERLKPGGVVFLVDFLNHNHDHHGHQEGHGHQHGHQHGHHGHHGHGHGDSKDFSIVPEGVRSSIKVTSFDENTVKESLKEAGLVDIDLMILPEKAFMEFNEKKVERTVFFARGKTPVDKDTRL